MILKSLSPLMTSTSSVFKSGIYLTITYSISSFSYPQYVLFNYVLYEGIIYMILVDDQILGGDTWKGKG